MENRITEVMGWVPNVFAIGHTTNERGQICVKLENMVGLQVHANGAFNAGTQIVKVGDKFVIDSAMGLKVFVPMVSEEAINKAHEALFGVSTVVAVEEIYGVKCVIFDPDPQMAPGVVYQDGNVLIDKKIHA